MKSLAIGMALALLAGQGLAFADERADLLDWIEQDMLAADLGEGMRAEVAAGLADLDGDGVNEALVYVMGSSWCGTGGCTLWVMRKADEGYEEVAMVTSTTPPIGVLETGTNGWRDLFVTAVDAGEPGTRRMRFDGVAYLRSPTDGERPNVSGATVRIAEDDLGVPMEAVQVE